MARGLFREKKADAILTVPTIITVGGIVSVVFYVSSLNFVFLFFAGFSDFLDGFLARRLKQKTFIGAILDSLRDRALMIAILYHLWYRGGHFNLVLIVILIEFAILIFGLIDILESLNGRWRRILGKTRQAGHLTFGTFGVLKFLSPDVALGGMIFFSALFAKALIARFFVRLAGRYLSYYKIPNLLEKGGMNGL